MMFMLRRAEVEEEEEGESREANQVSEPEVYIIRPLDRDVIKRIARGKAEEGEEEEEEGEEEETMEQEDEDDNKEWPLIDKKFVNQARIDFLRKFGD